jgi:hypothetical protein
VEEKEETWAEKLLKEQIKEMEGAKQVDNDEELENHVIQLPERGKKYHVIEISDNRRPIYGVLTEPIRGTMKSKSEGKEVQTDQMSYIPKAHVSFLE